MRLNSPLSFTDKPLDTYCPIKLSVMLKMFCISDIQYGSHLKCCFSWLSGESVQFSHSVVSNTSWPHGLQHTRLPCLSPIPEACSNSCPLRRWCHPTISSSVIPFSCLQSFPASGSFPINQFFASGDQTKYWSFVFYQSFQWIFRTDFL